MVDILLAEDDRNFGEVLKRELEEQGHRVDHVMDGVEAVIHCIQKPYQCVLLDIVMPRLNGLDALKIIKQIHPDIPVISFSGNAGDSEIARALELGALRALRKPFSLAKINGYLRDILFGSNPS